MSIKLTHLESGSTWFPSPHRALDEPNGLLAIGGDLAPRRLLTAYHSGIFPWYGAHQPILWWSPNPRAVLQPNRLHMGRSLLKTWRRQDFELWINRDFMAVVEACAAPRRDSEETWITPELKAAYAVLHRAGHAHSVEVWRAGELIGGLYGISVGRVFCGESMFHRHTDASKLALSGFCRHFADWGGELIDCQLQTAHLASLGVEEWSRQHFVHCLQQLRPFALPASCWTPQRLLP